MRWRSDLQTEEFSRQMPIGKMQDPMHRTPSFDLAIAEPRSQGQKEPDDNVLSENSPGEGYDHHEEFIEGPEPDQFWIVEMFWDRILVQGSTPPEGGQGAAAQKVNCGTLAIMKRGRSVQTVPVTEAVTIGMPVPAPTPTPTGIAT